MKESGWQECIESGTSRRQSPDKARAKSLIETAKERIAIIPKINEKKL